MNLNKKQQLVYKVITRYPECANDDALLLERYWIEIDHWDDSKSLYWNLQRSTHPETISRRRRELFNLGLITYTTKTMKARTDAFKQELNAHSTYEAKVAGFVGNKMFIEETNDNGERVMRYL